MPLLKEIYKCDYCGKTIDALKEKSIYWSGPGDETYCDKCLEEQEEKLREEFTKLLSIKNIKIPKKDIEKMREDYVCFRTCLKYSKKKSFNAAIERKTVDEVTEKKRSKPSKATEKKIVNFLKKHKESRKYFYESDIAEKTGIDYWDVAKVIEKLHKEGLVSTR